MLFLTTDLRPVLLFVHLVILPKHWRGCFPVDFRCLHRVHRSVCVHAHACVCAAGTASSRRMGDPVVVPQRPSLSLSGLHCLSPGANAHQTSRRAFGFMSVCWLDWFLEMLLLLTLYWAVCRGFLSSAAVQFFWFWQSSRWGALDCAWRVSPSSSEAVLNMMVANAKTGTGKLPNT